MPLRIMKWLENIENTSDRKNILNLSNFKIKKLPKILEKQPKIKINLY